MRQLFGIFLCFSSLFSYAQSTFCFEKITTSEGLSNNTVLSIDQDHDGRIWLATYDGLTYYDGSEFREIRYNPLLEDTSLPKGKAMSVLVDNEGLIWILFENNHLVQLLNDSGKCKYYNEITSLKEFSFDVRRSPKGKIYVNNGEKFYAYNKNKDCFEVVDQDINDLNYISEEDSLKKKIRQKVLKYNSSIDIYSIQIIPDYIMISSTNSGLLLLKDIQSNQFIHYEANDVSIHNISSNEVYASFIDREGNLWIGTKDGGVNIGRKPVCQIIKNDIPSSVGTIRAIFKDKLERVWIGTYNKGLILCDKDKYIPIRFSKFRGSKWDWIRSIHQGLDGKMWIGSYGGLCSIDPSTLNVTYYDPGEDENSIHKARIYSIAEDKKGNLFIGEWGGIDYYNKSTGNFIRMDSVWQINNVHVRKLFISKKGELWIGTESSGVCVVDINTFKKINTYSEEGTQDQTISSNSIFEISEDNNGHIWIGSFGGVNKIDAFGNVDQMVKLNGDLPSTLIYRMFWDQNNLLWFSTTNSMVKYDANRQVARVYETNDGCEQSDFAEGAGFIFDKSQIYFGGSEGIISFKTQDVVVNKIVPKVKLSSFITNYEKKIELFTDSIYHLSSFVNHISFDIHSVLINGNDKTKLAWKLEPQDIDYTILNGNQANAEYANLPYGKYNLKVKACNADQYWSEEESLLSFEIAKPIWLNVYFYLGSSIFLVVVIILFAQLRFKRVKCQNEQLESLIEQRTEKIEKQNQALEKAYASLESNNAKVSAQRDRILAQHAHLLEMHSRLEELNTLKQKFFTNVSHDIRTPLTLISAPLYELLNDHSLLPEYKDVLKRMQGNVNYILQLLSQVLDKKKLELGGLKKIMTHGDIVSVCKSVVNLFHDQALVNQQTLLFKSSHESFYLPFDHDKFQQIIYNLLANATKFTGLNGTIIIHLSILEKSLHIEISDTGIGIPENRIQHIFDRYYQVDKSNKSLEGNGIGLSMVKEFVDLLGGTVNVESVKDTGSCFLLDFPITDPEKVDFLQLNETEIKTDEQADISTDFETDPKHKIAVLVVEDNAELRNYLKQLLSKRYHVMTTENGIQALSYLKKNKAIDIIISDWMMTEMDGISFCKKVKKKDGLSSIPFILLTALDQVENQKEGYKAGVDEYMVKPFVPELLFLRIDNLVNRNKHLQHKLKVDSIIKPSETKEKTFDENLVEKISLAIQEEISNLDFNQQVLGNKLGLSQMQLYRKVKEHMNTTPNELIRSIRIKRAKQLLANDGFTINEVSFKVGFNDAKYFSRCFTKETGVSPSAYRKQQTEIA